MSESAIVCPEQVCYERILPQEAHFYRPQKAPVDTGSEGREKEGGTERDGGREGEGEGEREGGREGGR